MPTLPAERLAGVVRLLRRAGRRRPAHAHDRAHRRRPRRRGRELRDARRAREGRRRAASRGARVDADGHDDRRPRPRRRERDRRVVRRRPRARRGHAPDIDPPGQGHPHHGAVVAGAQRHRGRDPGAEGPAVGVRRAVGRRGRRRTSSRTSAPPTPTTTARSTTRSARPTTSSTCSRAINASVTTTITERRHPRHVGRPAPARARRRRASAPPTSSRRHSVRTSRRAASSRSPAASSRPTGAWPPTRSTRSSKLLDRGGPQPHEARPAARRDRLGRARPPDRRSATRYGGDAREVLALVRADADARASRSSPASPYSRAEVVYAVRAEMARTVDDVLSPPHPRPAARARRVRGRGRRRRRADGRRARLGRRPSSATAGRARTGRWSRPSGTTGGLPETALDALAPAAVVDSRRIHDADEPGRADAADRVRGRRRRRSRDHLAAPRVEVDDALRERLAATGADVVDAAATSIGEASRDWWPLAMIWALDGQVAARAARGRAARTTADEVADGAARVQRGARPGHRGRGPQRRVRRERAGVRRRAARPHRARGHRRRRHDVDARRRAARARSATCSRTSCAPSTASRAGTGRSRWRCRPSAAGSRAAARASSRRATGRSRTSSSASTSCSPTARSITTGGAPRAAVGPDLTQLFVGSEGTLGVIAGARLRAAPAPGRRGPGRVRVRVVRRRPRRVRRIVQRGATPGGAAPLRRDRGRPQLRDRRRARAARARRGRRARRRRDDAASSTRSARRPSRSTSALVEQWLGAPQRRVGARGADQRAASSSTRWRSPAPWRALPDDLRRARPRRSAASSTRWSRPRTRATRTPTARASTSRSRASRPQTSARRTTARRGTPGSARCSPPAARSATTTASASTGPASSREALGAGFDVLQSREGRARPERHPQPRQARARRARSATVAWP